MYKIKIQKITNSKKTINILDTMFKMPIFKSSNFSSISNINQKTSEGYLKLLLDESILTVDNKGKQRTYLFTELLNIINKA